MAESRNKNKDGFRVAIVFRDGKQKEVKEDNGTLVSYPIMVKPIVKYHFGNDLLELEEGQVYVRNMMIARGFHRYVHVLH